MTAARFSAETLGGLEYDFTGYGVTASGKVPPLSRDRADRFTAAYRELLNEVGFDAEGQLDPAKAKVYESEHGGRDDAATEVAKRTADCYAIVTNGWPTAEEMLALPDGVRDAFYTALQENTIRPSLRGGSTGK